MWTVDSQRSTLNVGECKMRDGVRGETGQSDRKDDLMVIETIMVWEGSGKGERRTSWASKNLRKSGIFVLRLLCCGMH